MNVSKELLHQASFLAEDLRRIRRHIHQNPELSFQEENTASFVQAELKRIGVESKRIGKTGVVAIIGDASKGKCVALRADLDALPITEDNEHVFVSKNKGVMHACGHDVHSTCLLGAAALLKKHEADLNGAVKLIFQPGEERLPGGASILISEKVLESPKVNSIFALHVFPELEVGKVGFREGMYMASCDELYVSIEGKGAHGAMPHQGIDTIYVSSLFIVEAQAIISRFKNPVEPAVLSFGKINSDGGATNVIPQFVHLEGTFRAMNEEFRAKAHEKLKALAKGMEVAHGVKIDLKIALGYPYLHNNEELTRQAMVSAKQLMGEENVIDLPIRMTAEDFSFYSQKVPACFFRLGVRNETKGIVYGVHHPKFDADEGALSVGAANMANLAMKYLG
jgi:amidohydrolase